MFVGLCLRWSGWGTPSLVGLQSPPGLNYRCVCVCGCGCPPLGHCI